MDDLEWRDGRDGQRRSSIGVGEPRGHEASLLETGRRQLGLGLALEAGMKVMSGSFTRQYPIARGDRIEARFDPIGPVRAEFV